MLSATRLVSASLLLASFASLASWAQSSPVFRFTEQPGSYSVGLKVVEQYDYTRTYRPLTDALGKPYPGERARPLQTLIWYPAQKSSAPSMTVRDYTKLMASETNFDKPALSDDQQWWIKGMAPALDTKLWAVRDNSPEPGSFPVVIYAPSFSAMSWENADLCEYLASNGYLVIASPDMAATTRKMTNDVAGINAQVRDISFLIGYAHSLPDADMSEIAVAGFSWGGISNLFAAARDNRIDALVSLDGSARYYPGLVVQAADVQPGNMTIPLLFFTQGGMSMEDQARYLNDRSKNEGPSVLNAWTHGDLITIHMLGMVHTEYSSMYQRNEEIWKRFPQEQIADYGREDGVRGYAWMARYTVHFLDAYLKHDAAAIAWLKNPPAKNGVPPHFLSLSFRAAQGAPATLDSFRAELGRKGFDHTAEVYAAMQKENPGFKLDEDAVNTWGYQLMSQNAWPQAIAVLRLNVQIYPDSANALDSLGEAYMKSGQRDLAIENYRKSLDKNPDNDNAKEKLKQLNATAPITK